MSPIRASGLPVTHELAQGEQVLTFRTASTARRLDHATGEWLDSGTLYLTVSCRRRRARPVALRRAAPQARRHRARRESGDAEYSGGIER
ncbi:hypothetical protein [Nocardia farcinica]|uniref:hypothetical protein n=1 Tax=Nocardia farcinica TaxID=37329 RepID=UPI0024590893|nr:hypothetical protein [Nocardia farcinica]